MPLRIRRFAALASLSGLLATVSSVATSSLSLAATVPPALHVAGNLILTGNGQPFFLHGIDRPSLEWSCAGQAVGGQAGIPASDFVTMSRTWGANTVRLALNQDFWLSSTGSVVGSASRCLGYKATVQNAVASAEAAGLDVVLDLHWSDEGSLSSTSVGQKCMADSNSLTFWRQVAGSFATDPRVMFELYNEPHDVPWGVWQNGGTFTCTDGVTYQAAGMQQMINAVRSAGATNVVLAGGLDWAYDLSGVPSHPLSGANVAYATHPYEFKSGDSPSSWQAKFGFLTTSAPVVATEFGTNTCGQDAYDTDVLRYFQASGMGYTAWGWWAGGCSFPALIADAAGTCVNGGCVTQADLLGYANGSRTVTVPPSSTGPRARFDFEDGTAQGWHLMWGTTAAVAPATIHPWSGTHSLGVTVTGTGYPGIATYTGLAGLTPGMTVTYHVWSPVAGQVSLTPFAYDGNWAGHFLPTRSLASGWNSLSWTLPAMTGLQALGLQVQDSSGWAGGLNLDAVTW